MNKKMVPRPTLADGTDHARLLALRVSVDASIREETWDLFCTLTFREEVTEAAAVVEFERRFVPRLQQRSQGRLAYIAVAARNHADGRVHIHALVRFVHPHPPSKTADAWRAGQAKVKIYDPCRGASRYIARHVALPDAETMYRGAKHPRDEGGSVPRRPK